MEGSFLIQSTALMAQLCPSRREKCCEMTLYGILSKGKKECFVPVAISGRCSAQGSKSSGLTFLPYLLAFNVILPWLRMSRMAFGAILIDP